MGGDKDKLLKGSSSVLCCGEAKPRRKSDNLMPFAAVMIYVMRRQCVQELEGWMSVWMVSMLV